LEYIVGNWQVIDKSFGFDTAVEEAQRAINAAHVEAESIHNGIGLVKLMGRYSGETSSLERFTFVTFVKY
jgi:6-phosphofructokinase